MDQPLLMSRAEAARSLGMSFSHFQRRVQAEMPAVKSGQLVLYRRWELEDWIDREIDRGEIGLRPTRFRLTDAHDQFIADCKAGVALTKRGRPYKPKAITNLDSSLKRLSDEIRLELLDALSRGRFKWQLTNFDAKGFPAHGSRQSSTPSALYIDGLSAARWPLRILHLKFSCPHAIPKNAIGSQGRASSHT